MPTLNTAFHLARALSGRLWAWECSGKHDINRNTAEVSCGPLGLGFLVASRQAAGV
jgi:hypothetical protein